MILLELLSRHDGGRGPKIWLTALAGGALGAISVTIANFATVGTRLEPSLALGLVFIVGIGLMFACNRWSTRALVESFEAIQQHLRDELARGLHRAPLRKVETFRERYGHTIGDLLFISSVSTQLVMLVVHAAFLICVTLVIAFISARAVLVWLLTCLVIAAGLLPELRRISAQQAAQSDKASELASRVEELLDGFKQVKLDPEVGDRIVADIHDASAAFHAGQARLAVDSDRTYFISAVLFFALGYGLIVFAPQHLDPSISYEVVIMFALSMGPLFGFLQALPVLTKVEVSARAIVAVLEQLAEPGADSSRAPWTEFELIELEGLRFDYGATDDPQGFAVGPIDLCIRRGELVLVTGNNGSGKTTLMKMLLGLYRCEGRIVCDGQLVDEDRLASYRDLFCSIFAHPTLFDELHGLDVEASHVEAMLERFGIADAVQFDGQRFTKLELSSGQRMRLAMVVALLEDRPICVFDEWTANQDPETTHMYYDTLLPELVAAGKTVIAVSHDDRFFARADHLLELERGRVVLDRSAP